MDDKYVLNSLSKYKFVPWKKLDKNIVDYLEKRFDDSSSIQESYYRLKYNVDIRPVCKYCGGYVKWYGRDRYSTYCSQKCIANDPNTTFGNNSEILKSNKIGDNIETFNDERVIDILSKYKQIKWFRLADNLIKYLENRFNDSSSLEETYYRILHNIEERPKCPICGGYVRFRALNGRREGFSRFCSQRCINLSSDVRNKMSETCFEHYGVDHPFKSSEVKNKMDITNLIKFGNIYPVNNDVVKDKIRQTSLKRYGEINKMKTDEAKIKQRKTNLERYGVENPMQIKETIDKRKDTWFAKYDCYPTSTYEVQQKINKTNKERNNHSSISKEEIKVKELLESKFNNVESQYLSKQYPFNCDFYIPELDLYIECNFHWTHGGKPYDKNDENCIKQLEHWKQKSENSKFYINAIHTWTVRDINKRNIAKENKLNYLTFYSFNEFKSWFGKQ